MRLPALHPSSTDRPGPWRVEVDAILRAAGGSLLFGMPLVFTMEMWWIGASLPRPQLVGLLLVALAASTLLARFGGFRDDRRSAREDIAEAIECLAIGVVLSSAFLFALGRLDTDMSLAGALGVVAVQAIPLGIGGIVANLVFDPESSRVGPDRTPAGALVNDLAATAAGALFLGFAIAPTEEIPMLSAGIGAGNAVALVLLTLLASYVIVFASGFDPSHRGDDANVGAFQRPLPETVATYVVSLAVAAALLAGFGQLDGDDSLRSALTHVLVLGVPAAIGGAAGRVVV